MKISQKIFGTTNLGPAKMYTLHNDQSMSASIIDFGAIITNILVPDRTGQLADVVLGYDDISHYEKDHPYFGAPTGRVANRISFGRFTLDGLTFQLPKNLGEHTLHSGPEAYHHRQWKSIPIKNDHEVGVELSLISPDKDQGFPGNLHLIIRYTLNNANELKIEYKATTDQPTILNVTNHSYFNLRGAGNGDILNHELTVESNMITEVDENILSTGRFYNIENTPMDFRQAKRIGRDIHNRENKMMALAGGYDHNFVFRDTSNELKNGAQLYDPWSGRLMEVLTTEPAVQLYTSNFLNEKNGKDGRIYSPHSAICLETQHFPDAINQPHFPSIILRPDSQFNSQTIYRFSIK